MLVLMLGELNYQNKLFPESTIIKLNKTKEDGIAAYDGVSESKDEYLQFPGDL